MKTSKGELTASVVIPNFNGEKLLGENLPQVLSAQENSDNHIKEVIVVDDGSTDASVSLIKSKFPRVKLIKHKLNRGFVSAVNTGARTARGDLIVLLNTDVTPQRDFLISVLPHFLDERVFGVSLHEEGYGWAKGSFENGFIVHIPGLEGERVHPTFWVSGGSGVFRRNYWSKLGGMNEKTFSPFYWEDLDLCYRAAKRGFVNLWEPKAKVFHRHETTISQLPKKHVEEVRERNQLLFIWKNLTSPALFRKHLVGLIRRVVRHPGYVKIVLMALLRIKHVLRARKKEKKEAKISDEAILARFVHSSI